ncbi:hypothetical protein [Novosphingobium resinovorum]|uniref:Uncharacterized protein n=1 Tax=Novosphingobium resinovorum TaxID=158500 RepID=A0A1D8A369_9SPHN|nr:hypothetical protein [Novosphingobium resinovorum]AOR76510.1 hypothetical protein BES08_06965 [Novosphingobium resinovorum]
MIHFHGGPITPDPCAIKAWKGRHAFISYAHSSQIGLAAEICQTFALDNGAFSFWKAKKAVDWPGYYRWVSNWRRHPGFDFAVVPDVIEGSEADNDLLANEWPFERHEAAVVWHINESVDRLIRLANEWPRVAIGSSGEFDVSRPRAFLARMRAVLPTIIDADGYPICKLHGLRMLNPALFSLLPLASADSTNVARNIGIDSAWRGTYQPQSKETRAAVLVERIEAMNSIGALPDLVEDFERLLG